MYKCERNASYPGRSDSQSAEGTLGILNRDNPDGNIRLRYQNGRNNQVTGSILEYYKNVEAIAALQEYSLIQKGKLRDLYAPLLKSDDWDKVTEKNSDNIIHPHDSLYLKSVNPDVINNCLLEINDIKGIHKGFKNEVIDLRNEATRLKKLIAQHYSVKQ